MKNAGFSLSPPDPGTPSSLKDYFLAIISLSNEDVKFTIFLKKHN
ncbi:hypothetical protein B4099_3529 [Heyndrickxia coagulans]|uniref:Uncharacterized protein n=1 Tax=Heyndrickxia coagulans TaxID=1398 RepID=A0A150K8H2_HEYCO|nr:hypothetical protein B4099_3529 [Heyndrickxia coagulans]